MKSRTLNEKQIDNIVQTITGTPLPKDFLDKVKVNKPIFVTKEKTFYFDKNFLYKLRNYEKSLKEEGAVKERKESILLSVNSFCTSYAFLSQSVSRKLFKRLIKRVVQIIDKVESSSAEQ